MIIMGIIIMIIISMIIFIYKLLCHSIIDSFFPSRYEILFDSHYKYYSHIILSYNPSINMAIIIIKKMYYIDGIKNGMEINKYTLYHPIINIDCNHYYPSHL